jgi:hypothetical protein
VPILTILFMRGNCFSYSIHKAKGVGPQSTNGIGYGHKGGLLWQKRGPVRNIKGLVPWMQSDGVATEPCGDHGGGRVTLHTITS